MGCCGPPQGPYGPRPAPKQWKLKLTEELNSLGHMGRVVQPTLLRSSSTGVVAEVHVNGFVVSEPRAQMTDLMLQVDEVLLFKVGEGWAAAAGPSEASRASWLALFFRSPQRVVEVKGLGF